MENKIEVKTKMRKIWVFSTLFSIIGAFYVLWFIDGIFNLHIDPLSWLIPWSIDGCWKLVLAIVLLLAIASGIIRIALVTLQSPVKQAITQSELDDLIAQCNGTRLTTNPGPDKNPVWSPDGTKIFFETRLSHT